VFFWNVASDASHPQAHIHGAVLDEPTQTVSYQPALFNNDICFGYPAIAANERGDFGVSLGAGGAAGGGADPVRGFVGISDEYSSGGTPGKLGTIVLVADGDYGPPTTGSSPNRWGDYVTVRPHQPCDLFFSATSYAFLGGTSASDVNARYVEFGRGRDYACYYGFRDAERTPLP
jgi:hypothetical protein